MTAPRPGGDHRTILAGTAANVIGLLAGVLAAFGVQALLGRGLPSGGLGVVTIAVQVAFVASAAGRFGMDMTAIRRVAIDSGDDQRAQLRSLVDRSTLIAIAASTLLAIVVAAAALASEQYHTVAVAATAIPAIAAANVYLGASRGLRLMKPTLWLFWIGQPVLWIAAAGAGIALGGGVDTAALSYAFSWLVVAIAARVWWMRLSAGMGDEPATREQLREAIRYGMPRAPSALFAQALFWADLFVLGHYIRGQQLSAYAAAGRVSQVLLLFVTSISLIFSPFAAELHARGETGRLDHLFKDATRWAVAATLPILIILFVAADDVLRVFGSGLQVGSTPLRIMLAGQAVNVATGAVAAVLVLVGRTGLDLIDNLLANVLLIGVALLLVGRYGPTGTAIASALAIAGVNLLRVAQVSHHVDIQPFHRSQLRLIVPAGACLATALIVHWLCSDLKWWVSLLATSGAGMIAYALLIVPALPANERSIIRARLRTAGRGAP